MRELIGIVEAVELIEPIEPIGLVGLVELVAVNVTLLGCASVPEGESGTGEETDETEVDWTIDYQQLLASPKQLRKS